MLTVLCWYWQQPGGRTDYRPEHVNIWAAMVRRHLSLPHRIACVTRHPEGIGPDIEIITPPGDFEDIRLPTWGGGLPQCLRRLAMFRPDAADIFGPRFVSMDIDCVIAKSLDPLFDRPDDFVMYRGTTDKRPYNGSMMMMTAGARPQVYAQFTRAEAIKAGRKYIGSDQAWISYVLGWGEQTWGPEHGVAWYKSTRNPRTDDVGLMFFPGGSKPWDLLFRDGWVTEHYRSEPRGRALYLGNGPDVWEDAMRAVGPFDAIVASPEVAAHVRADAVAYSDRDAAVWARLNGYDVAWCGRTDCGFSA